MKKTMISKKKLTGGLGILSAVILAFGCVAGVNLYEKNQMKEQQIAELPSYVDDWNEEGKIILDEDVPLASVPKTTTKTTSKTTKKTVTLSKKSTKTYTKRRPTTSKTSTKTVTQNTDEGKVITTKETTVKTEISEKYTKNSNKEVVTTKVTTTVKTTVTQESAEASNTTKISTVEAAAGSSATMDARVTNAFSTLGFEVKMNPSASYAGHFDARSQTITLKKEDDTLYHEMGHFLAFIAGNVDTKAAFKSVYEAEKTKYTEADRAYVTQSSSEYFAESFKNYTENPAALKASRPQTYASIVAALDKVTTAQVTNLKNTYTQLGIWS